MPSCHQCNDTGVVETGNNDFPCSCPAGDAAQFNVAGVSGPVSGAFLKRNDRDRVLTMIPTTKAAKWPKLNRGTLVVAIKNFDVDVADVTAGMLGVVFEEAEYHESNTGPMVRFINGCACNVYEGWVAKVK